ncbi:MAG: leucine-rich repeat domain-containing protein [Rectinemataceae bacterium]
MTLVRSKTFSKARIGIEMLACHASRELATLLVGYLKYDLGSGKFMLKGLRIPYPEIQAEFIKLILELMNANQDLPEVPALIKNVRILRVENPEELAMLSQESAFLCNLELILLRADLLDAFTPIANNWPKLIRCIAQNADCDPPIPSPVKPAGKNWEHLEYFWVGGANPDFLSRHFKTPGDIRELEIVTNYDLNAFYILSCFKHIGTLRFPEKGFKSLPIWEKGFGSVDIIDLSATSITEISDAAARSLPPCELILDGLCLTKMPAALLARTDLRFGMFSMRFNHAMAYAPGMGDHVDRLIARNLGWKALPPWIGEMKRLKFLDISGNPLVSLPKVLFTLPELEEVDASGCNLESIAAPDDDNCSNSLRSLLLSDNKLTALPEALACLPFLETIDLRNNGFEELSPAIGSQASLKVLWLNRNKIRHLPPEIALCTHLVELHLATNSLRSLPRSLSSLTSLKTLSTGNQDEAELWE